MKKTVLFTILILSLLLAACAGGNQSATVEPTTVPPTEQRAEPTAAPVETANADVEALTANTWSWIGFTNPTQQYSVDVPENYTLDFQDDGTVSIKADCNNAIGSYTLDGSSIKIEVGPMTMAACPEGSRSDDFVKYLGSAAIYFFKDGHLFIDLMADGGTMEFAPASETVMAEPGSGSQAGNLPRFEPLEECFAVPPEGVEVPVEYDCGYVVVPEFYQGESTREVKVPFICFTPAKARVSRQCSSTRGDLVGRNSTNLSSHWLLKCLVVSSQIGMSSSWTHAAPNSRRLSWIAPQSTPCPGRPMNRGLTMKPQKHYSLRRSSSAWTTSMPRALTSMPTIAWSWLAM